jgi:hypothetical protein
MLWQLQQQQRQPEQARSSYAAVHAVVTTGSAEEACAGWESLANRCGMFVLLVTSGRAQALVPLICTTLWYHGWPT